MDEATELAAVLIESDSPSPEAQTRLLRTLLGDPTHRPAYDQLLLRRLEGLLPDDVVTRAAVVRSGAAAARMAGTSPPTAEEWSLVLTAPAGFPHSHGIARRTGATLRILIAEARERVRLYAPYTTAPGLAMLTEAFEVAVGNGAAIELTTPETAQVPELLAAALPEPVRLCTTLRRVKARLTEWPHLKVVTIDARRAYVGSANLTAPGLGGGNLELGVLVDGEQVRQIELLLDLILE